MIDLLPAASDRSPLVSHLFKHLREQEAFTHPRRVLSNSILVGLDLATLSQHQASLPQVQVRTNLILFPLLVPTRFRRGYRSRQTLISSINLIPIRSINSIPINLTSSIPISLIPPNLIPICSISSMLLRSISPTPISSICQGRNLEEQK